jgi:hypothetical protein
MTVFTPLTPPHQECRGVTVDGRGTFWSIAKVSPNTITYFNICILVFILFLEWPMQIFFLFSKSYNEIVRLS